MIFDFIINFAEVLGSAAIFESILRWNRNGFYIFNIMFALTMNDSNKSFGDAKCLLIASVNSLIMQIFLFVVFLKTVYLYH